MHQKERTPICRAAKAISEALIGKTVGTLVLSLAISQAANAEDWKGLRISPSGSAGQWTEVPCAPGADGTWRLCQPPLALSAVAQPASIIGLPIHTTQITATLRDAFGNLIEPGVAVKWTATRGTLSSTTTYTDSNGRTQVTLAAFKELGGSTVTATAQTDEGGTASVFVSFIDSWIATAPTYPTNWSVVTSASTDASGAYGCDAWTPDPSTVNAGQAFTQTGTGCERQYTRQQQNREVSEVTGTSRDSGAAYAIYEVRYNQTTTRSASGTKVVGTCHFKYPFMSGGSYVAVGTGSLPTHFFFNKNMLSGATGVAQDTKSFSVGGKTYTVGAYKQMSPYDQFKIHEICVIEPPPPAATTTCHYKKPAHVLDVTSTAMLYAGPGYSQHAFYGGALVAQNLGQSSSIVVGGITYSRGAKRDPMVGYANSWAYELCITR